MRLFQVVMPDIQFQNASTTSDSYDWATNLFDAEAITIQAPAALNALTTITLQISFDGVTWGDLQDLTGTAIKAPSAASAAICYNGIISAAMFFRLKSATPANALTAFKLIKSFRT